MYSRIPDLHGIKLRPGRPHFGLTMKSLAPLIICFLLMPGQAFALKCGSKIVAVGDRMHKVHRLCGAPTFVDAYDRPISGFGYGYLQGFVHVDVWTYNFGPSRFMRELIFENGVLRYINRLEYGY
jgi:Protein of unknown function (DUF2845)